MSRNLPYIEYLEQRYYANTICNSIYHVMFKKFCKKYLDLELIELIKNQIIFSDKDFSFTPKSVLSKIVEGMCQKQWKVIENDTLPIVYTGDELPHHAEKCAIFQESEFYFYSKKNNNFCYVDHFDNAIKTKKLKLNADEMVQLAEIIAMGKMTRLPAKKDYYKIEFSAEQIARFKTLIQASLKEKELEIQWHVAGLIVAMIVNEFIDEKKLSYPADLIFDATIPKFLQDTTCKMSAKTKTIYDNEIVIPDDKNLRAICDFWTLDQRLKASYRTNPSCHTIWQDSLMRFKYIALAINCFDKKTFSLYSIRKFLLRNHLEVSRENPILAFAVKEIAKQYNLNHVDSYLQPCAGWSTYLLGAWLAGIPYNITIANDVNEALLPAYEAMHVYLKDNHFVPPNHSLVALSHKAEGPDFLHNVMKICPNGMDLIFTCPPYLDVEIYETQNANQSHCYIQNGPHDWYENFYLPFLTNLGKVSHQKYGLIALQIRDDMLQETKNYITHHRLSLNIIREYYYKPSNYSYPVVLLSVSNPYALTKPMTMTREEDLEEKDNPKKKIHEDVDEVVLNQMLLVNYSMFSQAKQSSAMDQSKQMMEAAGDKSTFFDCNRLNDRNGF